MFLSHFPTYQHLIAFVALFSRSMDTTPSPNKNTTDSINRETNPSQDQFEGVSAATLYSIIDSALLDAVRDNIAYQKRSKEANGQQQQTAEPDNQEVEEKDIVIPMTPKNIIFGLRAICSYDISNLPNDVRLVQQYLDAMDELINDHISTHKQQQQNEYQSEGKKTDDVTTIIVVLSQQNAFSLPDLIEELEFKHSD